MSSISVHHVSGPVPVASAKTEPTTGSQASQTQAQGTDSTVPAASVPIYPSPRIEIDPELNAVIIQYLNSADGLANYQTPSKSQLQLYQQNQAVQAKTVPPAVHTDGKPVGDES
jgi:hypothetical protein